MESKNINAVELGRLGGLAKSPAKAEAARRNGKRGGWPKGRKRKPGAAGNQDQDSSNTQPL